jgi:GNAT superfamily N-acetyltransferase
MTVTRVDVGNAVAAEALCTLHRRLHAADSPDNPPPLRESLLAQLRDDQPDYRVEVLGAAAGHALHGAALLVLPTVDNLHIAQVQVWVDPDHRRCGVGRALLDAATCRAYDEGRGTLLAAATGPVPGGPPRGRAGDRFLSAAGLRPSLASTRRRIDLSTRDVDAEQRVWEDTSPHAAAYDIVGWRGLTPDALAPGVALLANRLNVDAPSGDIDVTQTTLDTERLHDATRSVLRQGKHLVGVAAVHRGSGEVAAVTRIDVRPPGDHGDIWLTIASPRHRGHRLGTLVKIEAHRRVRELFGEIRYVSTGNADGNRHMVAINERLGYAPFEAVTVYQRRLGTRDTHRHRTQGPR